MIKWSRIDGRAVTIEKIANLYKEIWKSDDDSIKERFSRHTTYEGYKGMMIVTDENEIAGFAFGYTSLPGQYYHGLLAREFNSQEYETWLKTVLNWSKWLFIRPIENRASEDSWSPSYWKVSKTKPQS